MKIRHCAFAASYFCVVGFYFFVCTTLSELA